MTFERVYRAVLLWEAVLGLGGIPTIGATRSKVNRVQPYRGQAPLPHGLAVCLLERGCS